MVVRRLDLEERVDLDNVEGTSEASLAASVPRVSTDALPTQEPGPGPDRARQRRQVESGTAEQRSELIKAQAHTHLTGRDSGVRSSPERQSSDLS
jgi:hypothetical protein